jgi:hypothetical protein
MKKTPVILAGVFLLRHKAWGLYIPCPQELKPPGFSRGNQCESPNFLCKTNSQQEDIDAHPTLLENNPIHGGRSPGICAEDESHQWLFVFPSQ